MYENKRTFDYIPLSNHEMKLSNDRLLEKYKIIECPLLGLCFPHDFQTKFLVIIKLIPVPHSCSLYRYFAVLGPLICVFFRSGNVRKSI